MGWMVILLLALLLLAGLWRFARLERTGLQLLGAALLLALAGYAWQGHPDLAGSPKRAAEQQAVPESAFAAMRRDLLGQFDTADHWLTMADSYSRQGDTEGAAQLIAAALRAHPNNPTLWIGYGNALVVHAGGMMTPAAELAFRRAGALAPNHPAPQFFYGLALAQGGRLDEAEAIWRRILAGAPPSARWRAQVERQIALVERARAIAAMQGQ
ncbi:MAG TPA: tetratricopeptide repeat protein [Allosphingosinicella sp.]|jgi:cytochrome c-type biogenesis protein CcmH/NrfG